jgi:hypothetical protein
LDFILSPHSWPIWVAFVLMAVAAGIHLLIDVVPNGLALGTATAGLVTAGMVSGGIVSARGGLSGALLCLFVSAVVMVALHVSGVAPGGTAKMHIAYCTWLGCAAPPGSALLVTLVVTGAVMAAGAVGFAVWLRERRVEEQYRQLSVRPLTKTAIPFQLVASTVAVLGTVYSDWLGVL